MQALAFNLGDRAGALRAVCRDARLTRRLLLSPGQLTEGTLARGLLERQLTLLAEMRVRLPATQPRYVAAKIELHLAFQQSVPVYF